MEADPTFAERAMRPCQEVLLVAQAAPIATVIPIAQAICRRILRFMSGSAQPKTTERKNNG